MKLLGILPFARSLLEQAVQKGDTVIDGTAGNGHDTVFLAELVGEEGLVCSFDIQQEAIKRTKQRVVEAGVDKQVQLHPFGHERVREVEAIRTSHRLSGVIFNLGYLPRGDKSIVTQPHTTIEAINGLLAYMQPGGIVVLVIYHGHPEGTMEKDELLRFATSLPQQDYHVLQYSFMNQKNDPPIILAIETR
ncbi:class I SAM-dependent methyltransferase [Shouchella shacheensis]|uniref:class I SAM-dependent methyltransferase n=1 Tax=Shouchella shacheensis TaxID=1649580 RepID=UPI0007401044|nr:class I SAM-dependent methyltransferase [Shouchella shacheensis]